MRGCISNTESCPRPKGLVHYVVVRADLPHGVQTANVLHAAGESASPKPEPGCIAVALHARDEAHLLALSEKLTQADLAHSLVRECDDDDRYPGQLMAIGLNPTTNRDAVRKVLSALPLIR